MKHKLSKMERIFIASLAQVGWPKEDYEGYRYYLELRKSQFINNKKILE